MDRKLYPWYEDHIVKICLFSALWGSVQERVWSAVFCKQGRENVFRSDWRVLQVRLKISQHWNQGRVGVHNGNERRFKLKIIFKKFLLTKIVEFYLAELKVANGYWTSGSNDGFGCEFTYGWCGSKTLVFKNLPWCANEPNALLSERGLELGLNNIQNTSCFNDLLCTEKRFYICEVRKSFYKKYILSRNIFQGKVPDCSPTCPDTCETDVKTFLLKTFCFLRLK